MLEFNIRFLRRSLNGNMTKYKDGTEGTLAENLALTGPSECGKGLCISDGFTNQSPLFYSRLAWQKGIGSPLASQVKFVQLAPGEFFFVSVKVGKRSSRIRCRGFGAFGCKSACRAVGYPGVGCRPSGRGSCVTVSGLGEGLRCGVLGFELSKENQTFRPSLTAG